MEQTGFRLTEKFIMLSHLFMQKHHQMWANHRHDPFRGQGRILALLKMQPEISQKELAYLLGIRPQSLGELLTKLEQTGYIARTTSAEDRRAMEIRLTAEGEAAAAANEQRRAQELADDEMFQCLNQDEQKILAGYLDRIITALKATLAPGGQIDFPEHGMHPHFCGHHHMRFGGWREERF